jgi:hypothetical protein
VVSAGTALPGHAADSSNARLRWLNAQASSKSYSQPFRFASGDIANGPQEAAGSEEDDEQSRIWMYRLKELQRVQA